MDNVAIEHNTAIKIQEEGIKDVDDLEMVDMNFLKQLTDNLKYPDVQINMGGIVVATPAFKFGVKSKMIL